MSLFDPLIAELSGLSAVRHFGRVAASRGPVLVVEGLETRLRVGDRVRIGHDGPGGEVLAVGRAGAEVLAEGPVEGIAAGDPVEALGMSHLYPCDSWLGRVIDPFGAPLDDRLLLRGPAARPLRRPPPPPARRRRLGRRLETGIDAFNTLLPLVRGQRLGLFAGSGVGKTTLLGQLARGIEADVVVLALVGERGRELREFLDEALGPEGLARAVVVAATSDRAPAVRRRAALAAMTVAEHFRDEGQQVLLLCDSITRFAEAHREIALAAGEGAGLRGFPPSTAQQIMSLAERAGPGEEGQGDITAIFTVLVAGSDMDEPVADILRGVLDGHVVLDRAIAERGRFPAIDLLRSVSRSLPRAATPGENAHIAEFRRLMVAWERAEMMVQAGLYAPGSDALTDRAIRLWPKLDTFLAGTAAPGIADSFARLARLLES